MGTCCRRRRRRRSVRPLAALRDRFTHVPAAVLRRSESGAARAAVIDDVRAVFPDVPRDAGPERLIRHARRLVLAAARDEFAREGVELVDLPEGWGRAELRRADLAGEEAFRGFVEEVIGALDIVPSPLEKDDALELRGGGTDRAPPAVAVCLSRPVRIWPRTCSRGPGC